MLWQILNVIVAVAWIACLVLWVRRGCPISRKVHVFAGVLFLGGVIVAVALRFAGITSLKLAASCVLLPPAVGYLGWLWLFGPIEDENG